MLHLSGKVTSYFSWLLQNYGVAYMATYRTVRQDIHVENITDPEIVIFAWIFTVTLLAHKIFT